MVGDAGLEPATSSVWRKRSAAELIAQPMMNLLKPVGWTPNQLRNLLFILTLTIYFIKILVRILSLLCDVK